MEEFEREMEENMKKRAQNFSSFISNLEQKYAPQKKRKAITTGNPDNKKKGRKAR